MEIQAINLQQGLALLKTRGYDAAAELLQNGVEVLDVACTVAGYEKRDTTRSTATTSSTTSSTAGGAMNDLADCNPTVREVQRLMQSACGQVFEPCWADMVAFTVGMFRTIPEIKAYIGRTKARLLPTGVTGSGLDAEGEATTFVANFPVAPGESIALAMEDWPYPFPVECLAGALAFSGGNVEENYMQVILQAFSGDKAVEPTASNLGALWNDADVTYGSELRCGDNCRSVFLKGQTCGPSVVGVLSELRLVITNKSTASANITRQQLQIHMGGIKKYCCDACAVSKGGGCGGSCKK